MTTDQWDRLKALFEEALKCSASERTGFLDLHCGSDSALREQLQRMLASQEQFPDFLETPVLAELSTADAVPARFDDSGLAPGDLLDGKYRVEQRIGSGGMGVVYKVLHTGLGRVFAAKVLNRDTSEDVRFLERFRVEAEALGGLEHPNIVNVTDFGVDSGCGVAYLITEYLEGETLADRLRASGPLPVDDALPWLEAMGNAIDHAHRQGVLHLDLKPGNVFLARRGGSEEIKILDFGLAEVAGGDGADAPVQDSPSAGSPPRAGTPAYMAPELVQGKTPCGSSDIYALGVVIYEALTGRRPFEGSVEEILRRQRTEPPKTPSEVHGGVPAELDAAILRTLAKEPAARPATARDVVDAIRQAGIAAAMRTWRRREIPRRGRLAAGLGILAILVMHTVSGLGIIQDLEGTSLDARFAIIGDRPPNPEILLLLIDDDTLTQDSTLLGAQGDRVGTQLQRVFEAGARGVAIDLLLPEAVGRTEGFSQLVLHHADKLTLAALSTPDGVVIGPECVSGAVTAALGSERAAGLFGFVNTVEDHDGVHRRSRLTYETDDGGLRPSWAARAASTLRAAGANRAVRTFWIDRSVDHNRLERVSWKDLDAELVARPARFRNRLVLVGATWAGTGDEVRLSSRSAAVVPGVMLQALAADSILSGLPVRDVGRWAFLVAVAVTATGVAAAMLGIVRLPLALVLGTCALVAYAALAFLVFAGVSRILPMAGPLITIAAVGILTFVLRALWLPVPRRPVPQKGPAWQVADDGSPLASSRS